MRDLLLTLTLGLLASTWSFAQPGKPEYSESAPYQGKTPKEVEKLSKLVKRPASTDLTLSAAVYSKEGSFVPDLDASEFEVLIDGKPAPVTSVTNSADPINIVLVLDTSPSASFQDGTVKAAATALINGLGPQDRLMIVTFSEKARVVSDFSDDRKAALKSIQKLEMQDGTSLYNTIGELFLHKLVDTPARTAMILVTDGVDTTSRSFSYESSLWAAEMSNIPIFPFYLDTSKDIGKTPGMKSNLPPAIAGAILQQLNIQGPSKKEIERDYDIARHYVTDLLSLSGGRPFRAEKPDVVSEGVKVVASEVRHRYYLSFTLPPATSPGARHSIALRVKRPQLTVLTKASYLDGR